MDTTSPAAAPRVYARFRRRALALAIDIFIVAFLIFASKLVLEGFDGRLGSVGALAIFIAYFAGCPLTKWRATPGKHACGIRITDRAGDKLGPARSLLRAAASLASMAAWGLGYAVALWTRRHQALHDLVAGTLVVHDAAPREALAQVDPPAPPLGKRIVKTGSSTGATRACYPTIVRTNMRAKRTSGRISTTASSRRSPRRGSPCRNSRGRESNAD